MFTFKKIKFLFLILFTLKLYAQENNCLHKVKKDENIIKILKNYNKSPIYGNNGFLKELLKLNNFKNINLIYPGQTIIIPKNYSYQKENPNSIMYIVKKNDTLSQILKKYNLFNTLGKEKSLKNTLELNPHIMKHEKNGNLIYPNEIIYLNISQKFSEICLDMDKQISDINNISSNLINNKEDIFPQKENIKTESVSTISETRDEKENESYITASFYLKAIDSYERIDIYDIKNNSNAALISKAGYGLILGWNQYFTKNVSVGIKGKYQYISFKQFNSNNLTTDKKNISDYEINSSFRFLNFLNFSLFTNKRYFLYTYSTKTNLNSSSTNYNIIIDSIPQYGLGFKSSIYYDLQNAFKINGYFSYAYYFPQSTTNYNISPFHLYLYGTMLEKEYENLDFYLGIDYSISKQNTSLTTQKLQILDIIIGATINIE